MWVIARLHEVTMLSSRGHQAFSVKGQRLNILGFVGHMFSASHIVSFIMEHAFLKITALCTTT